MSEMELIHGVELEEKAIVFSVRSTGLTNESYFKLEVDTNCKTPPVTLFRIKEDTGKMMPHIVTVKFSREEHGIDGCPIINVANLFSFSFSLFT